MASDSRSPHIAVIRRPPESVPDEAIERVVPRKQLLPVGGDVMVSCQPASVRDPEALWWYRVQILGTGLSRGSFAAYEHAVTTAAHLATQRGTRVFYTASRDSQPELLKDRR